MEKTIFDLGLHEIFTIPHHVEITRVYSGWIYRFWDPKRGEYDLSGVFVPEKPFHQKFLH
jgi:hypothetical protein